MPKEGGDLSESSQVSRRKPVVALVAIIWATSALADETLKPCTYTVDNPRSLAETRTLLQADAFAEAYDAYLRDLDAAQSEFDALVRDAQEYYDVRCRTFTEALRQWESDVADYKRSYCATRSVTPEELPECKYRFDQLEQRRVILVQRFGENQATEADLHRRNEASKSRSAPALEHALTVLDPDHVEDALRLYISWIQRNSTGGDCTDFSRIAEQLGKRVSNREYYLAYLARNLAPHPNELNFLIPDAVLTPFTFHARGFKREFRTEDLDDNQVRHAMSYVVTGYLFRDKANVLIAKIRDELKGEPEDYRLGVLAGYMGFQLKTGTYNTANFGRAIGARMCE
jgi:hypothetical protein